MILKAQKSINYAVLKDNQSRHLLHTTNWDTVLKEMTSKCKLIAFIDKNMCPLEDRPHSYLSSKFMNRELCEDISVPDGVLMPAPTA